MVKIDFEIVRDGNVYRDALHLPDDHTLTDSEIDALKEERYANWLYIVNNPPPPEPDVQS